LNAFLPSSNYPKDKGVDGCIISNSIPLPTALPNCGTFLIPYNKKVLKAKTQKTPRREIEKAKAERDDWISRKG
jgi:hypothetical protein